MNLPSSFGYYAGVLMASKLALSLVSLAFLGNFIVQTASFAEANAAAKPSAKAAVAAPKPSAKAAVAVAKPAPKAPVAKSAVKANSSADKSKAPADKAKASAATAKPAEAKKEDISDLAPVLPPENFFGAAAMGYAAAKANPRICSKIFCYCGCDITDNHSNLLDCFTGMHGADCHICQEEALQALRMNRDGSTLADIQKQIDSEYSMKYPFKDESPALKKYRSARLYTGNATATTPTGGDTGEACCGPK
jgi:hypothetical protein